MLGWTGSLVVAAGLSDALAHWEAPSDACIRAPPAAEAASTAVAALTDAPRAATALVMGALVTVGGGVGWMSVNVPVRGTPTEVVVTVLPWSWSVCGDMPIIVCVGDTRDCVFIENVVDADISLLWDFRHVCVGVSRTTEMVC